MFAYLFYIQPVPVASFWEEMMAQSPSVWETSRWGGITHLLSDRRAHSSKLGVNSEKPGAISAARKRGKNNSQGKVRFK